MGEHVRIFECFVSEILVIFFVLMYWDIEFIELFYGFIFFRLHRIDCLYLDLRFDRIFRQGIEFRRSYWWFILSTYFSQWVAFIHFLLRLHYNSVFGDFCFIHFLTFSAQGLELIQLRLKILFEWVLKQRWIIFLILLIFVIIIFWFTSPRKNL